ncbi:hypothetical protein R1sor_002579 [Riccia sorocarpa]|uniref:Uncharacterized protein n=1 Tax=Riccia sorocarpa TaxID=122646 RepID=A0ABD3GZ74_9MARC
MEPGDEDQEIDVDEEGAENGDVVYANGIRWTDSEDEDESGPDWGAESSQNEDLTDDEEGMVRRATETLEELRQQIEDRLAQILCENSDQGERLERYAELFGNERDRVTRDELRIQQLEGKFSKLMCWVTTLSKGTTRQRPRLLRLLHKISIVVEGFSDVIAVRTAQQNRRLAHRDDVQVWRGWMSCQT